MEKCAEMLRKRLGKPEIFCSVILGSAWQDVSGLFRPVSSVDYSAIPCMGPVSVKGHSGRLTLAEYRSKLFLLFEGRHHLYEKIGWDPVVFPVILSILCRAKFIMLTNAAGGISPHLAKGSLMLVSDHINLMGASPLDEMRRPGESVRFPDQCNVYSRRLRKIFTSASASLGEKAEEGVYAGTHGPEYETPSEVRSFAGMGADAVGMSTVPEAMVANAGGLPVIAVSYISNMASGISGKKISHKKVASVPKKTATSMKKLTGAFIDFMLDSMPSRTLRKRDEHN